jgi:hypothetical protein
MTVTMSSLSMVASTLRQPVEEAGVGAKTLFRIRPIVVLLLRTTERAFEGAILDGGFVCQPCHYRVA